MPQSRPRFYMVALLQPDPNRRFSFPAKLRCPQLSLFLDKADAEPVAPVPRNAQSNASLLTVCDKLRAAGKDPATTLCLIDIRASPKWANGMASCCPCLTATRCAEGGHYISTYQRLMTVDEMCRLQCIPPGRYKFDKAGIRQKDFLHAVGNAMSANVLARVLDRALHAAGLTHMLKDLHDGDFMQTLL